MTMIHPLSTVIRGVKQLDDYMHFCNHGNVAGWLASLPPQTLLYSKHILHLIYTQYPIVRDESVLSRLFLISYRVTKTE